ncbi:MAG: hypothetical protein WD491_04240 [Balneolales bacterium]
MGQGHQEDPRNGIAINGLHDRAFEEGLITITPEYTIRVASAMKRETSKAVDEFFLKYEGKGIFPPSRFLPDVEFLKYHNDVKFQG